MTQPSRLDRLLAGRPPELANAIAASRMLFRVAHLLEAHIDAALQPYGIDMREYLALVRECPELEASLLARATHELAAAQNQMLLLGRKTARERIASFLLDLPGRDPIRPSLDHHVRLPMTRMEIASSKHFRKECS